MEALSTLFEEVRLFVPQGTGPPPIGLAAIRGEGVSVTSRPAPVGRGFVRKLTVIRWFTRNLPVILNEMSRTDAIHALVPGDVGFLGLILALVSGKPLFVRHCGTWGHRATVADRLLMWTLRRVAGGKRVVMATGGGEEPPEPANPEITWIFSTSLTEEEVRRVRRQRFWSGGPLRLVSVGRLDRGKNTIACVEALPTIRQRVPGSTLEIVGDGPERRRLELRAAELGLQREVTFHGNVRHGKVLEMLRSSDLFLFPTRVAEGFPKAVLEALACGLPVIAPRVSVLPHLLGEGCGVLLSSTDPADLAAAVVHCAKDPVYFREMAQKGENVAARFTLERWAGLIGDRLRAAWGEAHTRQGEADTSSDLP